MRGDGAIDISVSGGTGDHAYNWSNGANSEDLTGLLAGSYSVTVSDQNGCTTTAEIIITQPTKLELSESHLDLSCFGLCLMCLVFGHVTSRNPEY